MAISRAGGLVRLADWYCRWLLEYDTDTRDLTLTASGDVGPCLVVITAVRQNGQDEVVDVTPYVNQGPQVFTNVNLRTRQSRQVGLSAFEKISCSMELPL
jgi:hypothetical protein